MKAALIQMNSGDDRAANIRQAEDLVARAVEAERPDWVLLPECFDFLGGTREGKRAAAAPFPDGEAYRAVRDMARRHGVWMHAGSMLERLPGEERIGNTAVAFDRAGREVARYRKLHLFDVTAPDGTEYRESASFAPGEAVVVYDCEGVTVGCSICYDVRFPLLYQALMDRGAELVAVPAAFTMQTGKDHWEVLLRARAVETATYVAAAAQTGAFRQGGETRHTYGHSMLVDPWGLVTARASDGTGFAAGRVERERIAKVRAMIPVARHRREMPRG